MKIEVLYGTDTKIEIIVNDGATVADALKNKTVVTVCGEQGAARVNQVEVTPATPLKEGDVVEPVTVANEKS